MATLFEDARGEGRPDVVVLGSGTIGRPVQRHLGLLGARERARVRVPWSDDPARRSGLRKLSAHVVARAARHGTRVVWAAGATGFSASAESARAEAEAFEDVVALVEQLPDGACGPAELHVVSSAGGLFEGTRVASVEQQPAPLRPYGYLKLAQERAARRLGDDRVVVHRPSSVFSSAPGGGRPGLLGVMVEHAVTQRSTTIFGAPTTLRDYVDADDVGRYVAATALGDTGMPNGRPRFLVSGRPRSITEIVALVGRLNRRPVLVHYRDPWNSRDIVFSPTVRAGGFRATPLEVSVRRMRAAWLTRPRRRA